MCLDDVYISSDLIDCLIKTENTWSSSPSFIYLTLTFKMVSFPFPLGISSSRFTSPFHFYFPFLLQNLPYSLWGRQRHSVTPFQAWIGVSFQITDGGTMDFKIPLFGLKRSFSFHFSLGVAKAFYTPFPFTKLTDDAKKDTYTIWVQSHGIISLMDETSII